jgi:hypothetical protein
MSGLAWIHIVILAFHCRPTNTQAGNLLRFRSEHVYANVYVVAGCVGVRADLVCKIDHLPRQRLIDIWKMNPKFSGDSEPTFRACSDCDRSCDSSIRRSKTRTGADGCQFATRAEGFESLRVSRIPPMRK